MATYITADIRKAINSNDRGYLNKALYPLFRETHPDYVIGKSDNSIYREWVSEFIATHKETAEPTTTATAKTTKTKPTTKSKANSRKGNANSKTKAKTESKREIAKATAETKSDIRLALLTALCEGKMSVSDVEKGLAMLK